MVSVLWSTLTVMIGSQAVSADQLALNHQSFSLFFPAFLFGAADDSVVMADCALTLEGRFHSTTLNKITGSEIGDIARAATDSCSIGHATVLAETLPWHVGYMGFVGRLPAIERIRISIVGMTYNVEPGLGILCLARTTVARPAMLDLYRNEEGPLAFGVFDGTAAIAITPNIFCPSTAEFFGTGHIYKLGTVSDRIVMTLI